MSNTKISQLPEFTGNTSGSYLVMNNSGQTTTYRVNTNNVLSGLATTGSNSFNGNQTITGSLNVSGNTFFKGTTYITGSNGRTTLNPNSTIQESSNGLTGSILTLTSFTFSDPSGDGVINKKSGNTLGLGSTTSHKVVITGSMTFNPLTTLPTGTVGSLAVSGSNLFYHNGSSWTQIN